MPKILSSEERATLLQHHISQLRAAQIEKDKAQAPFKAAQEDFTAKINAAKADLGTRYSRKRLVALLEKSMSRARDLVLEEQEHAQDHMDLGLPLFGHQPELFDNGKSPAGVRDAFASEADGYLAGRRGDARSAPSDVPPEHVQGWLKGWDKGQDETQKAYVAAQELMKTRAEPDAGAEAVNLNDGEIDPAEVEAQARKLRRRGFTKPSAVEPQAAA